MRDCVYYCFISYLDMKFWTTISTLEVDIGRIEYDKSEFIIDLNILVIWPILIFSVELLSQLSLEYRKLREYIDSTCYQWLSWIDWYHVGCWLVYIGNLAVLNLKSDFWETSCLNMEHSTTLSVSHVDNGHVELIDDVSTADCVILVFQLERNCWLFFASSIT